jgi:lactate dehydrogenase-like 2-hydroxyacid dehydrogenase
MGTDKRRIVVGITHVEFQKGKDIFLSESRFNCIPVPETETELSAAIIQNNIDHIVIGAANYRDELYRTLSSGSVIARFGVGHDGVDKIKASKAGIFCTNTPGVLDNAVAEYTMCLILSAARRMNEMTSQVKSGIWNPLIGFELKNKKLAVIGCGPIGRRVAQIASSGFGMNVTGCEIQDVDTERMKREFGFQYITKEFGEAVKDAGFVSLHFPATEKNYRYINKDKIALIPSGCWLINTSRGAILHEDALYEAISSRKLSGAILDVTENEPYFPSGEHDLRSLDNVLLMPHVASSTREACDKMASRSLENIYYAETNEWNRMDLLNKELLIRNRFLKHNGNP